ncbi:beta-xylosidase [Bombiscardovia nodaiensis]|uniref:Beta-xylosidase n=1 Tax=Bombiscardovia nodaiensis TaxID=2932181 RepID=A0ABM8B642_9BIFI|nr:beta-xylosidase [Bombiscardovia nodaiensis]
MSSPNKKPLRTGLVALAASVALLLTGALAACGSTNSSDSSSKHTASTASNTSSEPKRVSVHDPSIVKSGKEYYVFGSHRAYAKSSDMVNWTPFTNNLSTDYEKIFADIWKDWPKQSSNPDVKGNMWAPDVIYNKALKKWTMYLSLNGAECRSVIVMLTADKVDGDWTYVGPVVYSGFNRGNFSSTDVGKVLGEDADLSRYQSTTDTGINAIDPSVKYDENGDLWMTFGSWFGGIWMIKLDAKTGLRDYATTYPTQANASDGYYGHKLAGGFGNSGEGSYLIRANDYWYLFLSYGHLEQKGGYQIRMFRSKSITGPYLDEAGHAAVSASSAANNWTDTTGVKLLSSYQWSGNKKNDIEVSQGHNSALVDTDGSIYLVYHTRFSDKGEEHQIRVRQLMPTADDWLVAAPYEYRGTKADPKGYKAAQETGKYELLTHEQDKYFKGPRKVTEKNSTDYRGVNKPQKIELKADGSITGDVTGSWKASEGSNQVSMEIKNGDHPGSYQGAFAKLPRESDGKQVMTFSAIGSNLCIWGSQY